MKGQDSNKRSRQQWKVKKAIRGQDSSKWSRQQWQNKDSTNITTYYCSTCTITKNKTASQENINVETKLNVEVLLQNIFLHFPAYYTFVAPQTSQSHGFFCWCWKQLLEMNGQFCSEYTVILVKKLKWFFYITVILSTYLLVYHAYLLCQWPITLLRETLYIS